MQILAMITLMPSRYLKIQAKQLIPHDFYTINDHIHRPLWDELTRPATSKFSNRSWLLSGININFLPEEEQKFHSGKSIEIREVQEP